ncbi:hypothetical protein WJX84_008471 [Apatococcus fuscideae]|uniref:Major facilitator superfamily (MFS) profile domain-containing protein n=1 Tax=Apatococcus fuscideae TaxID=2026836 RepID=A0AAW1S6I9_9CHLO
MKSGLCFQPVLMVGIIFTSLSTLLFGFSDSFAMAVAARVLGGLFSSTGVCMKAICGEAWDTTSQAKSLGIMSLGWTMGSTLGPAFAGAFSEPCIVFGPSFPFCGPHGLFQLRPYALGCIMASSLATMSFMACLFVLPETHPRYRKPAAAYKPLGSGLPDIAEDEDSAPADQELELAAVHSLGSSKGWRASQDGPGSPEGTPSRRSTWQGTDWSGRVTSSELGIESQIEAGVDAGRSSLDWAAANRTSSPNSPSRGPPRPRDSPEPSGSESQLWDEDPAGLGHHEQDSSWWSRLWPFRQRQPRSTSEAEYTQLLHQQRPSDASRDSSRQQSDQGDNAHSGGFKHSEQGNEIRHEGQQKKGEVFDPEAGDSKPADWPWWRLQKVLLPLILYFIVVFFANMLEELTPIYASAPTRQGGLGLPLNLLAWPLSVAGAALVVFTLYGYPSFQARVGVLACCGSGILLNIPAALVMPLPSLVLSVGWLFWVLVYGGSLLKAAAKLLALTPSTILINQAAPRSQIGAVNGAGNTLGSFSRAAGPALAGVVWGQMAELHFWGHQFVPFGVVGVAAMVAFCWLLFMRHTGQYL